MTSVLRSQSHSNTLFWSSCKKDEEKSKSRCKSIKECQIRIVLHCDLFSVFVEVSLHVCLSWEVQNENDDWLTVIYK